MPLLYRKQGHTGILTFSRPEARNCWGQDYAEGLLRRLDEAADDDDILVVGSVGLGGVCRGCLRPGRARHGGAG